MSTFAPVDNIPVPEGYRLGVGDELRVMLIGKEQGDFPLLIDRDGSVTLPKLGRVVLSGLTFPEAKTLIEKRVSEQLIGSEAILSMGFSAQYQRVYCWRGKKARQLLRVRIVYSFPGGLHCRRDIRRRFFPCYSASVSYTHLTLPTTERV